MSAPAERLASMVRDRLERRTALPAGSYLRDLTCTGCGDLVSVFEAATGARTRAEHEHIDPDVYRCNRCLLGECQRRSLRSA